MESVTIDNFSGGIADNYLSPRPGTSKELHNFLLDENLKPYTRPGFFSFTNRAPVSTGSTRISGIYLDYEPFGLPIIFRADKAYAHDDSGNWDEITGPASNSACPNKTVSTIESAVIWQKQIIYASGPSTVLPHRIYCSAFSTVGTFGALTLGLPALASTPTATAGSAGSTYSYLYSFHYYFQFTDYDGTTYEEKGPVTELTATAANAIAAGAGNTITLTSIPTLANTSSTNYIVSTTMKIKIFRTVNNGSTSYLLTTLNNGTTSYADTTTDAAIQQNEVIYTDGGVLQYTQPPIGAKYCTQVNDLFWFATDRKLIHSIQGAPGACPEEYEYLSDQLIRGLGSVISFPILFCDRSVYRVEGAYDEFGDGGFELREISKVAGCISHKSIVSVPGGIAWAGNGGFYFTDGYQVKKISTGLTRYETWKNEYIAGAYDAVKNIVFWTISSSDNAGFAPTDAVACWHLNAGVTEYSSFTTIGSVTNIYPTALAFCNSIDVDDDYRGKLVVGDGQGYMLYMDDNAFADINLDTQLYPYQMRQRAIIYRYESAAFDLGNPSNRNYCVEVAGDFAHETELATQFFSRRDDGGSWGSLSEIREDGAIIWGISEYPWDDDADDILHNWNDLPTIDGRRHFPAGTLRSNRRQLALTNAKTWITKSDDKGTATTNTSLKTITLNDVTQKWPEDCEDYEVLFGGDSYTNYFKIKTRDSDTQVTVYDPYGTLPSGTTHEWQMRGYRKFERCHILSYTVYFDDGEQSMIPNRGDTGLVNA